MRYGTFFGILIGFVAIFGAFLWEGGTINSLFMLPAMLIVFGGTIAAGMAGTSVHQVMKIPKLVGIAFAPVNYDKLDLINQIVYLSGHARKEGILSLEPHLKDVKHPFLRKLIMICIDGNNEDSLQKLVESEVSYLTERHNTNIQFFVKLGGFSPTMGIIGTVMGLISTLAAAGNEPNILIRHIATAFIATMWGIFMANIVWLPIGDKLRTLHTEEMQIIQMMLDGVHCIQQGEPPTAIRAKLIGVFPISEQDFLLDRNKVEVLKPTGS